MSNSSLEQASFNDSEPSSGLENRSGVSSGLSSAVSGSVMTSGTSSSDGSDTEKGYHSDGGRSEGDSDFSAQVRIVNGL